MEKLKSRYLLMQKALLTFKEILEDTADPIIYKPRIYKELCDGAIQRFEYCIDSFWKFLKLYLETVHQLSIESSSPVPIIKLAFEMKLLREDEYKILLKSLRDRNLTSHTYNEEIATEIQEHLPSYCLTMQTIINRVNIS